MNAWLAFPYLELSFRDTRAQVEAKLARRGGGGYAPAAGGGHPLPPPVAVVDVPSQLEKLEGMLQRGTLTPSEFEAQKRKLLGA